MDLRQDSSLFLRWSTIIVIKGAGRESLLNDERHYAWRFVYCSVMLFSQRENFSIWGQEFQYRMKQELLLNLVSPRVRVVGGVRPSTSNLTVAIWFPIVALTVRVFLMAGAILFRVVSKLNVLMSVQPLLDVERVYIHYSGRNGFCFPLDSFPFLQSCAM